MCLLPGEHDEFRTKPSAETPTGPNIVQKIDDFGTCTVEGRAARSGGIL
jgi:hypothetical protein